MNFSGKLTENKQKSIIRDFKKNAKIDLNLCEITGKTITKIDPTNIFCYDRQSFNENEKHSWEYLILLDTDVNSIFYFDVNFNGSYTREQTLAYLRREYFKHSIKNIKESHEIEIETLKCNFNYKIKKINEIIEDYKLLVKMLKK